MDDWEDVAPTAEALKKLNIPAERIRPYKQQRAYDRM
jgi:hypothetical protein